jgi:hypothetical protein
MVAAEAGMIAHRHWRALDGPERVRLTELLRISRGRPGSLTDRERDELKALMAKLDVVGMGRELLPFGGRMRRGR